jgi:XrtJ-associated TM-motif-TM protein
MRTARFALFALLAFIAVPTGMYAQGGCVDSPEASTDILMLIGTIGMIYGSSLVIHKSSRDRKK